MQTPLQSLTLLLVLVLTTRSGANLCSANFYGEFDAMYTNDSKHFAVSGNDLYEIGGSDVNLYMIDWTAKQGTLGEDLQQNIRSAKFRFSATIGSQEQLCAFMTDKQVFCETNKYQWASNLIETDPIGAVQSDSGCVTFIGRNGNKGFVLKADSIVEDCPKTSSNMTWVSVQMKRINKTLLGVLYTDQQKPPKSLILIYKQADDPPKFEACSITETTSCQLKPIELCRNADLLIGIIYYIVFLIYFVALVVVPLYFITQAYSDSKQMTTMTTGTDENETVGSSETRSSEDRHRLSTTVRKPSMSPKTNKIDPKFERSDRSTER